MHLSVVHCMSLAIARSRTNRTERRRSDTKSTMRQISSLVRMIGAVSALQIYLVTTHSVVRICMIGAVSTLQIFLVTTHIVVRISEMHCNYDTINSVCVKSNRCLVQQRVRSLACSTLDSDFNDISRWGEEYRGVAKQRSRSLASSTSTSDLNDISAWGEEDWGVAKPKLRSLASSTLILSMLKVSTDELVQLCQDPLSAGLPT